jgi:hypothetical protein
VGRGTSHVPPRFTGIPPADRFLAPPRRFFAVAEIRACVAWYALSMRTVRTNAAVRTTVLANAASGVIYPHSAAHFLPLLRTFNPAGVPNYPPFGCEPAANQPHGASSPAREIPPVSVRTDCGLDR